MRTPSPIYVETRIATTMEALWKETQDPVKHRAWDLRFTEIRYLPKAEPTDPQRFLYATRIGFGLRIEGRGESVANRDHPNGERTSVLRFWSDDWKSIIREGGGYWRYVPEENAIRFLTLYSYQTRGSWVGALFDRAIFRPLLGWATAWSFDCLRIALETGASARRLWTQTIAVYVLRVTQALVWIYQGVVPKLLFRDTGELEILRRSGVVRGHEELVLTLMGEAEVLFGIALLVCRDSRRLLVTVLLVLPLLLVGAMLSQPALLVAPFNPIALTLALAGLAVAELWLRRHPLPDPSRCLRRPPPRTLPLP